ncbi:MAG: hypothetical protein AAGU11_02890 [Syntrophobacteraceae bacterium]
MRRTDRRTSGRLDQVLNMVKQCYGNTPFEKIGEKLEIFLIEVKAAAETGSSNPGQVKAATHYVEGLLRILPKRFGERFYFDTLLIRNITDEWSKGPVKLPHTIIPSYGTSWGHRTVEMPSEVNEPRHCLEIVTFPFDDAPNDIDLLSYPWLYHELGHVLLSRHGERFCNSFEFELNKEINRLRLRSVADKGTAKDKARQIIVKILNFWLPNTNEKNWAFEVASDVIALWTCGPSFLAAFQDEVERDGVNPYEISKSHPPYELRARVLMEACKHLGWPEHLVAQDIISKWRRSSERKRIRANELAAYASPDIFRTCLSCSLATCKDLQLPMFDRTMITHTRESVSKGVLPELGADLLLVSRSLFTDQREIYDQWEHDIIRKFLDEFS